MSSFTNSVTNEVLKVIQATMNALSVVMSQPISGREITQQGAEWPQPNHVQRVSEQSNPNVNTTNLDPVLIGASGALFVASFGTLLIYGIVAKYGGNTADGDESELDPRKLPGGEYGSNGERALDEDDISIFLGLNLDRTDKSNEDSLTGDNFENFDEASEGFPETNLDDQEVI